MTTTPPTDDPHDDHFEVVVDLSGDAGRTFAAYLEAFAAKDLDAMVEFWDEASTYRLHPLGETTTGVDGLRAYFAELFEAVPDLEVTLGTIHGDAVVATGQWHIEGTVTGPLNGIEPTGRRISLDGVDVARFEGSTVRTNEVYYDGLTFARQVGLLPAADSAADRGMLAAFNAVTTARAAIAEWLDQARESDAAARVREATEEAKRSEAAARLRETVTQVRESDAAAKVREASATAVEKAREATER
jgi:steroid delta-isomerase-like uncharacterized protein